MTAISEARSGTLTRRVRRQASKRQFAKISDRAATALLWMIAGFIALVLFYIVAYSVIQGIPAITHLGVMRFLTSGDPNLGIGPQIFNTFYLLLLSLVVMIPVGISAAIYMVEYARQGIFVSILRFATETLTSVPSIVIGIFGSFLFVSTEAYTVGPLTVHGFGLTFSRIAGALTLAVLNLPWMLRTTEDALRAVPNEYREASMALGATRVKTVFRVILPAAIPGIITGILIVAGRVTGESAALFFTAGEGGAPTGWLTPKLSLSGDTLAVHAYTLFAENPGANALALRLGTSLVLIVIVLVFNVVARIIGNVVNRRFMGAK